MPDQPLWLDIGPCVLEWKGDPVADIATECRFRVGVETATSLRSKTGDEAHDEVVSSMPTEIESDLAIETLEQLVAMIPGAALSAGPVSKSGTIKTAVGYSLRSNAGELVLKPIEGDGPTTDETKWIKAALAHPKANFDVVFDAKSQRLYKVVWRIFSDATTGNKVVIGKQVAT